MASFESSNKSIRSHSIHVVFARDYQRLIQARKLDMKLKQDLLKLERKMNSNAKWNERADQRNVSQISSVNTINAQDRPPMTLQEFLVRDRIKQDNISNAKKVANENIRRK
jgi:hypothetical protein